MGEEDEEEGVGVMEGEKNGKEVVDDEDEGEEDEEEFDMELVWKMLETARVMFEEDANAALELVDVLEMIGELNME